MSLAARAQMRPVFYPAAILVAFVLNFLVDTGVSPYAAGRPIIVALLIGLALPWLTGLATGDRDRAGLLGVTLLVMVLAAGNRTSVVLSLVVFSLVAFQPILRRRSDPPAARARDWPPIATRLLTIGSVILLVAVGIKAVQLDRVETFAQDLVAEFPLRPRAVAASPASTGAPNMFFLLLDGYPRADKLSSEFGIDNSGFISDLRARDFVVADHSRSNQVKTEQTLAQMFNYRSATAIAQDLDRANRLRRVDINDGAFFADLHRLGYETVAVSPAFEHVALRRADVFVDTGQQLNEFEWAMAGMTGLSVLFNAVLPDLAADAHRARILDAFAAAERHAQNLVAGREFIFVHVVAPHAPQVFAADGRRNDLSGFNLPTATRQRSRASGSGSMPGAWKVNSSFSTIVRSGWLIPSWLPIPARSRWSSPTMVPARPRASRARRIPTPTSTQPTSWPCGRRRCLRPSMSWQTSPTPPSSSCGRTRGAQEIPDVLAPPAAAQTSRR